MSDPLATGILLKLDVTVWTGSAALSAPDLGLDPGTVAAHYTLGRKRLVPKAALDPIATIVRQARYALEGLSHALPDGSRFVLAAATPEVEAQLTRTRARFGHAVETFLAGYPRWRAEMAPQWDAAARAAWHTAGRPGDATPFVTAFLARVAAAYPMADALRRRFDFLLRKSPPGLQRALRARFRMRVSRGGLDRHLVALPFKRLDRAALDPLGMQAIEVVGPGLAVGGLARQQMIRRSPGCCGPPRRRLCCARCWRMSRRYRAARAQPDRRVAARAASVRAARSQRFPRRVFPDLCFPALSLLPGQRPAQLARCPALGKTVMSTPISAISTSATRGPTPGISSRRAWSAAYGAMTSAMRSLTVAIASSK